MGRPFSGRRTKLFPSHLVRYERQRRERPERAPGEVYTAETLARAIARGVAAENRRRKKAAANAGKMEWPRLETWTPYRLRHAAATRIRKEFGIETGPMSRPCAGIFRDSLYYSSLASPVDVAVVQKSVVHFLILIR